MLRAYFSVAERCAGRLVRIHWMGSRPAIGLAWPRVLLIAMEEPTLELTADRRAISVAIEGGLLVMPASQPRLVIALTRQPGLLEACFDLVDYQPRGGHWAIINWLYGHTQVLVHVRVGNRYLRELRREWAN
jgi:hypothetical protein